MIGTDWIDVRDQLPREGMYLAVTELHKIVEAQFFGGGISARNYWLIDGCYSTAVTHWMPRPDLPPPPRPRGPFSRETTLELPGRGLLSYLRLQYEDSNHIDLHLYRDSIADQLIDWLNEMWAKRGEGNG